VGTGAQQAEARTRKGLKPTPARDATSIKGAGEGEGKGRKEQTRGEQRRNPFCDSEVAKYDRGSGNIWVQRTEPSKLG